MILIDEADNFLLTESVSGVGKGFKTGMLSPNKRKFNDGTVATSKSITFQLLDRAEQDERLVWIDAAQSGFSPSEVDGINDITASFNAEPAATDTTLIIDLVSTADNSTALAGLVTANFLVTVDEVVTATTFVESTSIPGRYTGTLAALSEDEVVTLQLWDAIATPQVNAIIVGDDIYRSNVLTATVTA